MTLTDRLHKLNEQRGTLMARRDRLASTRKSTAAVERELVRTTCKVLKFELKAEKVK